jgi:hypothetical protein
MTEEISDFRKCYKEAKKRNKVYVTIDGIIDFIKNGL